MFLKNSRKTTESSEIAQKLPPPYLLVITAETDASHRDGNDAIRNQVPESRRCDFLPLAARGEGALPNCEFVLSLFIDPAQLDGLADQVLAARRGGRATTLIVAVNGAQLVALGKWLDRRANEGKLAGMRLILADSVTDLAAQLGERLQQVREENVIRMPLNTEIENSPHRNFYVFSPELHALVARIRGFAQNGITRACLLGGPGSGKTSLAYYYFLVRERGRFVSVNLSAENTGDKAAVKSLLCGHVSGAFPGAAGRTGAFSHARDGVCFLDESHGVMGAVMEVLMEALDSGQYLPYGASAKQQLECALLFATNRSWEHLQNSVNLDEFTRMGAATLQVPELARRPEDMIAVAATTLARLASKCTTWTAPAGLSGDAWKAMRDCRWHGNVRGVIRTLEAAFVDTTTQGSGHLIQTPAIEQGIALWEPKTHHSHQIYATN